MFVWDCLFFQSDREKGAEPRLNYEKILFFLMQNKDPKGYYAILQVSATADTSEIKSAFKRRAMELHPDRNRSPSATHEFQKLNEAYEILSNSESRAQYDIQSIQVENSAEDTCAAGIDPIVCSCCGKISAQPRYVIFYMVKSYLVMTSRSTVQGIFCSACSEKRAIKASLITWLLGWWGIPWGPIYSVQALFANALGGKQPDDLNARILAHQAMYFASIGKFEIAGAIARECLVLIKKTNLKTPDVASIKIQIEKLLTICGDDSPQLRKVWKVILKLLVPLLLITITIFGWIAYEINTPRTSVSYRVAQPQQERYVRPLTAPNGSSWPLVAAYVPGYPVLNQTGLSTVSIDNRQNDSDVFVKLVALDSSEQSTVRTLYIPAYDTFTLNSVTPGRYDVRYRDLKSGGLFRSEPFSIEETKTYNGTQYTDLRITLYKVRDGNMRTFKINESDF